MIVKKKKTIMNQKLWISFSSKLYSQLRTEKPIWRSAIKKKKLKYDAIIGPEQPNATVVLPTIGSKKSNNEKTGDKRQKKGARKDLKKRTRNPLFSTRVEESI